MPISSFDNLIVNRSNIRPVSKSITGIFFYNVDAYETEGFINAHVYGESAGRALTPNEMQSLKHKIEQIVNNFNNAIASDNLSNEDLELAKMIYIYNYILKNVQYADVVSANDGTARVQNRPSDSLTPYESAYSALILNSSICCGISDAIFLLCKALGVECEKWLWPDGGHAYNKVKIGNIWYKVDATFQIGFYPHAKAERWSDTYLLTATTNHEQTNETPTYPRQNIQRMKTILENHGVDFNYHPAPRITINTTMEGLKILIKDTNKSVDEQNINFQNLQNIISSVDSVLSSTPQITIINKRTEKNTKAEDKPKIYFIPKEKKITIQKTNYKINITSVNDAYAVNVETTDNNQHTQITNNQGKIIGILKRGHEVISSLFDSGTVSNNVNPHTRISNISEQPKRYR